MDCFHWSADQQHEQHEICRTGSQRNRKASFMSSARNSLFSWMRPRKFSLKIAVSPRKCHDNLMSNVLLPIDFVFIILVFRIHSNVHWFLRSSFQNWKFNKQIRSTIQFYEGVFETTNHVQSDVVIVKCQITLQIPFSYCHTAKVNIELMFTVSAFSLLISNTVAIKTDL